MCVARLLLCFLLCSCLLPHAHAGDTVRIWVKAFIPSKHVGNPGYIRQIGDTGKTAVPAPPTFLLTPAARLLTPSWLAKWAKERAENPVANAILGIRADGCFLTDQREFSDDPAASARLTLDFSLTVEAQTVALKAKGPGGDAFRAGATHFVDCDNGKEIVRSVTSDPMTKLVPGGGSRLGQPVLRDGKALVFVKGAAGNPLAPTPEMLSPAIDFSGTVTFDPATRKVQFKGSVGAFPAFEAYASLNGGPARRLFRVGPAEGTTVWNLVDWDTGINIRSFTAETSLDDAAVDATTRWIIPRRLADRSAFVAAALAAPKDISLNATILSGIASSAAEAGMPALEVTKRVTAAKQKLEVHAARLAELGLDLGYDKLALLRRKAEVLRGVPELRDVPFTGDLLAQVDRWGQMPSASTQSALTTAPQLALDRFMQATLMEAALRVQQDEQSLKAVFDGPLSEVLPFKPGDDLRKIVESYDHLVEDPLVRTLVNAGQSGRIDEVGVVIDTALIKAVKSSTAQAVKQVQTSMALGLAALQGDGKLGQAIEDQALVSLTQATGIDALRVRASVARLDAQGLSLGTADAGVFLASTVAGVIDPQLGQDVQRFGSAALTIAQAVNGYGSSAAMGNSILGVGAAAATGDYLGAAMAVAGMLGMGGLGGSGPDPALQEIKAELSEIKQHVIEIKEQIKQFSEKMDARFDRVDSKLDTMYKEMISGFERIEQRLANVNTKIDAVDLGVVRLGERLSAVEAAVVRGNRDMIDTMKNLAIDVCTERKRLSSDPLPRSNFVSCMIQLNSLAVKTASLPAYAGEASFDVTSPAVQSALRQPHWKIKTFAAAAAAHGVPLVKEDDMSDLPGAGVWGSIAADYLRLAKDWPEHLSALEGSSVDEVVEPGQRLDDVLRRIGSAEKGPKLFTTLTKAYLDRLAAVIRLVEADHARTFGHDVAVLPVEERKMCSKAPHLDNQFGFPMESRLVPGVARALEASKQGRIKVCIESRAQLMPSEKEIFLVADLRGDFEYADKSKGVIPLFDIEVGLPSPFTPPGLKVVETPAGQLLSYFGSEKDWLTERWSYGLALLRGATAAPMAGDIMADTRAALVAAFGSVGVKMPDVPSAPIPPQLAPGVLVNEPDRTLVEVRGKNGTMVTRSPANSARAQAQMMATMEEMYRPMLYQKLLSAGANEAIGELDAYAALITGFVELGFSEELSRNDMLRALVKGEAQLIGRAGIAAAAGAKAPPGDFLRAAAKRAQALNMLIAKAVAERTATGARGGDPAIQKLIGELEALDAVVGSQCARVAPSLACFRSF